MNRATILFAIALFLPLASADFGATDPHYNQAPPTFGATVTIPANVAERNVYGSLAISPNALTVANVTITLCGGATLQAFQAPAVAGLGLTSSYAFTLTGGDCYQFNDNSDPVSTNRIVSYNYVDVLNESFEGQDHANATWCPLNGCVSNDYANGTVGWLGPTGVHVTFLAKEFGAIGVAWDPNSVRPGGAVYVVGIAIPYPGTSLVLGSWGPTNSCQGTLSVYGQLVLGDPSTNTPAFDVPYDCNIETGNQSVMATTSFAAQTVNDHQVLISWENTASQDLAGWFELASNQSDMNPISWGAYSSYDFSPYFFDANLGQTSRLVETSDFANNADMFLRLDYWTTEGPMGASCEVHWLNDSQPHVCPQLPTGGGGTTYNNSTIYVNTSFPVAGVQYIPFIPGQGQEQVTLNVTGSSDAISGAGWSLETFAPGGYADLPLAVGGFEDVTGTAQSVQLLRGGTIYNFSLHGMGPYHLGFPVTPSPDPTATMQVDLLLNGASVGTATWMAGEDAIKNLSISSVGVPFAYNDNLTLHVAVSSSSDRTNANIYNGLMGVAWLNASAPPANVTIVTLLATAFDQYAGYIPVLLWGGLALYALWINFFPTFGACVLALVINVLDMYTPRARLAFSVLLVISIHSVYAVYRWRRNLRKPEEGAR